MGIISAFLLARLFALDHDFPPISGSLGEYADMGYHFVNLRMLLLEGTWDLERIPILYFCPVYYAVVLVAHVALGSGFEGWRATSLLLGSSAIFLAWRAAEFSSRKEKTVLGESPIAVIPIGGPVAALMLAADPTWFSYMACEKQELTAATLLLVGASAAGGAGLMRSLLLGCAISLAVGTKLNAAVPAAALLAAALAFDTSLRTRPEILKIAGGLAVGGIAALLFLIPPFLQEGSIEQVQRMASIYSLGVYRPETFRDALINLVGSPVYVRSTVALLGISAAVGILLGRPKRDPGSAVLAALILACAAGPLTNGYYPLRYRVLFLPAAAALIGRLAGFHPPPFSMSAAAATAGFLGGGWLGVRLGVLSPEVASIAGAICGYAMACGFRRLRRAERISSSTLKRSGAVLLLAVTAAGVFQIAGFLREARRDLPRVAELVNASLAPRTPVATNSWFAQTILLATDHPEVDPSSSRARAWLVTRDPDGSWSRRVSPPVPWERVTRAFTYRSWFGVTYELYVPSRPGDGIPAGGPTRPSQDTAPRAR